MYRLATGYPKTGFVPHKMRPILSTRSPFLLYGTHPRPIKSYRSIESISASGFSGATFSGSSVSLRLLQMSGPQTGS